MMARQRKRRQGKLRHPWLDEDDPANTFHSTGYWVPTPEEIEYECSLIPRRPDGAEGDQSCRTFAIPKMRKHHEESQLCDCPYWGTEFEELR